jgi:hypothetical protein
MTLLAVLLLSAPAWAATEADVDPARPGSASELPFSAPLSAPNITLKYPADGGAVPGGKKVQVKWYSNNTTSNSITVEVAEDGVTWKSLATGKPSNGTADWDVPAVDFPTARVRVTGNTSGGPINATASNVHIDSKRPSSFVHDLHGYKNCIDAEPNGKIVPIPFSAWDNASSGIAYVELWWRIEHRGGPFTEESEIRTNKSPFQYEMKKEGTYELFSIAVDRAGNREKEKFFNDTSVTLDGEAPQVFNTVPEPDTTITFRPSFQILFSEKMNTTDYTQIKIDPPGPQPVRRSWDEYFSTLSFSIDQPLVPGKNYTFAVSGTKDKCGKILAPMELRYTIADPPIPAEGNISGQVVHAFTQEPVAGAAVGAWYNGTESLILSVTTGSGGLYDLERIPPTEYNLSAKAAGFAETELVVTLDPDGRPFVKLEMVPENELVGWVRGTVTGADRKPVEGASLEASTGSKATTDQNGHYRLTLRPGKNSIRVFKEGVAEINVEVEVAAGQTVEKNILLATVQTRTNLVPGVAVIAVSLLLGLLIIGAATQKRSKARALAAGAGGPPAQGAASPSPPPARAPPPADEGATAPVEPPPPPPP